MDLCLACRGCETACPSGVPYGRMIEAARAGIEQNRRRSLWNRADSKADLSIICCHPGQRCRLPAQALYLYQASGLQKLVRATGILEDLGASLANIEALSPTAEVPFFYSKIGKTFPADRRAALPGGLPRRMHRERGLCAVERSNRPRAAAEWLRGRDSRRPELLRRASSALRPR